MKDIEITARAKAFSTEPVGKYHFAVTDEDVLVWDSVAGHYTTCNSLSAGAKKRIRKMAMESLSAEERPRKENSHESKRIF